MMFSLSLSQRWVKQESELAKQEASQDLGPKLDLGFKEGQTIKINIGVRERSGSVVEMMCDHTDVFNSVSLSQNMKKKDSSGPAKSRPVGGSLLPPPPGVKGGALSPPAAPQTTATAQPNAGDALDPCR